MKKKDLLQDAMPDERDRKEALRRLWLAAHPEWAGRIRIYRECVTIRGFTTTYWREPWMTVEAEAKHFLDEWEWTIKHESWGAAASAGEQ